MSRQQLQLDNLGLPVKFTGIAVSGVASANQYSVSIAKSIARILTTRIGERVGRPTFGSHLYLLRDRDFNSVWRVMATRFIYEAIKKWEPRVTFKQLHFVVDASTGKHTFYLELDPA